MCKAVEEYAERFAKEREENGRIKGKVETVKNMLKNNIAFETALKIAEIDRQTYEKFS